MNRGVTGERKSKKVRNNMSTQNLRQVGNLEPRQLEPKWLEPKATDKQGGNLNRCSTSRELQNTKQLQDIEYLLVDQPTSLHGKGNSVQPCSHVIPSLEDIEE